VKVRGKVIGLPARHGCKWV